jgi:hypothetical protein
MVAVCLAMAACSSAPLARPADSAAITDSAAASLAPLASTTTTHLDATTSTAAAATLPQVAAELSATELAGELSDVERAAAGGDASVGTRQQLLYRTLAAHPELDETVLAAMPDDLRPFAERIVSARQLAQARRVADTSPTAPSPTLPAWSIVEPLPAAELLGDYHEAEDATGLA